MSVCCGTNVYFAFICFLSGLLFVIVWFDQGLIHTLNRSEKSSYKLNVYLFFFSFFFFFFFKEWLVSFSRQTSPSLVELTGTLTGTKGSIQNGGQRNQWKAQAFESILRGTKKKG